MKLTHAEWRGALAFLHRTAAITSDSRSEFSLLSDVTGVSSLVDLMASAPGTTPGSVLGPFHTVGSPWLDNPANLVGANTGEVVVIRGQVRNTQGKPLPEATLDYWQNAATASIGRLTTAQPPDNLRCQMRVDADGAFEIATIRPVPYEIPTDGPVWNDLVQPAGRSSWRSAHCACDRVGARATARWSPNCSMPRTTISTRTPCLACARPWSGTTTAMDDTATLTCAADWDIEGDTCPVMKFRHFLAAEPDRPRLPPQPTDTKSPRQPSPPFHANRHPGATP